MFSRLWFVRLFFFSGLEQESSKRLALAANATLTWQKKNDALASHLVPADYVVATVMKQMTLKSQLADGGEIHRFGVFKQFRFGDYSSNTASVSLIPGAASSDALNRHTMHIHSLLHTEFPEPECVGFIIDYEFALREVWGTLTLLGIP